MTTTELSHLLPQKQGDESSSSSSKTIGLIGSIAIAVNSLAGPAILQLPFQYQQSGIIPTTICLVAVATLSAFCSLHMASVVSKVPGNEKYNKCIEFSDVYRIFWSERAYRVTQIMFYLTAVCVNLAAIVDTAQTVDSALGLHATTYGYSFDKRQFISWSHIEHCTRYMVKQGDCTPFESQEKYGEYILTLGYLLTSAVFMPLCLMDLKENSILQIVGFIILMTTSAYFCVDLSNFHLTLSHVSLWGHKWDDMVGVILFNFALVLAIPAWLHEKKSNVGVGQTIFLSTIISLALYIGVGIMGALAIPKVNINLLDPMVSGAFGPGIQLAASVFAFFIIGLDIPLFSVLTRYNLTHSGLCTVNLANWFVVWIPWSIGWAFYAGDAIGKLLAWGGVLLLSSVAFLLPLSLAYRALKTRPEEFGAVDVYGPFFKSLKEQKLALRFLLGFAATSVVIAILGEFFGDEATALYLSSASYLNSTPVEELLNYPQKMFSDIFANNHTQNVTS